MIGPPAAAAIAKRKLFMANAAVLRLASIQQINKRDVYAKASEHQRYDNKSVCRNQPNTAVYGDLLVVHGAVVLIFVDTIVEILLRWCFIDVWIVS